MTLVTERWISPQRDSVTAGHEYRAAYWPEIDGLRAIAVIAVLIFHLDAQLLPGGFAGVDVFFVISGYLITTLLINDIRSDRFSILRFYQRRIARIAPAALLVIACTMIAGAVLYSDQDFASLGANGLAATLSAINVKLLYQGSYFKISPDAQPLLHYWSLAVEEQFYLCFPLLLYLLTRVTNHIAACLVACCGMSFVLCILMTPSSPDAAFYLLPPRAWELLAGSVLAVRSNRHDESSATEGRLFVAGGLILVVTSFLVLKSNGFPGWKAALPVAGSTLLLAGTGRDYKSTGQALLARPLMVFIGKRSYSLYLWHWPVFSFVDYQLYPAEPGVRVLLKITISILATMLTYRFIERPCRSWLNAPQRRSLAFGSFALAATVFASGGDMIRTNYYLSADPGNIVSGGIFVNPNGRNGWVVAIGDSQAAMYGRELASLARELDFRLNLLGVPNVNELPGEPDSLWPRISAFLGNRRPDVAIIAEAWSPKLSGESDVQFGTMLRAVAQRAREVIILTEPPAPPEDATREGIRSGQRAPFFETSTAANARAQEKLLLRKFAGGHIHIVDATDIFLNSDSSIRLIGSGGRLTFQDSGHLSGVGTALVRPRLEQALRNVL